MNNTKWRELANAVVRDLPFPPAYQRKDVLNPEPEPVSIPEVPWYVGDWREGLMPFYSIEWIRVVPCRTMFRGRLLPPDQINIRTPLVALLSKAGVDFREDLGGVFVYGYR